MVVIMLLQWFLSYCAPDCGNACCGLRYAVTHPACQLPPAIFWDGPVPGMIVHLLYLCVCGGGGGAHVHACVMHLLSYIIL